MAFFYYYNPPLQPLSQYLFQGLSHGGRGLAETPGIDPIKFFEGVRFTIYLQGRWRAMRAANTFIPPLPLLERRPPPSQTGRDPFGHPAFLSLFVLRRYLPSALGVLSRAIGRSIGLCIH